MDVDRILTFTAGLFSGAVLVLGVQIIKAGLQ